MAFFVKILNLFKGIGFVVVLFLFSYVLTSVTYYSRTRIEEVSYPINIIEEECIEVVRIENKEDITIEVSLKENIKKEKLIAYSLSYFDIYNKEIHLYVIEENKIVSIGKNEISYLTTMK